MKEVKNTRKLLDILTIQINAGPHLGLDETKFREVVLGEAKRFRDMTMKRRVPCPCCIPRRKSYPRARRTLRRKKRMRRLLG